MDYILPETFDPVQLSRIESVHRGFLYQHLYAVGCLYLAQRLAGIAVLVEKDEDIELVLEKRHLYIQVKTRSARLIKSDVSGALSRFDEIRILHSSGKRDRSPEFYLVSNVVPSPGLLREIEAVSWPDDIQIVWPDVDCGDELPPAWSNIEEALYWLNAQAQKIPFSMLSPENITWKLASIIQFACTGSAPREAHQFVVEELPGLFEQLQIQLHNLPLPPEPYLTHVDEPPLASEAMARLIVGISGAGKTSWASQVALHSVESVIYYDVGDTPFLVLASSLAREIAAKFSPMFRGGLGSVLLPGVTGIETLRLLNLEITKHGFAVKIFLDNVHCIPTDFIRQIIQAMPDIHFILIGQPWPEKVKLEAFLGIQSENLAGWSVGTIAEICINHGLNVNYAQSYRLRQLTSGMPLFVLNSIQVIVNSYDGNVQQFCEDLAQQAHLQTAAQELILSRTLDQLEPSTITVSAILSLSTVPLEHEDVSYLLEQSLGMNHGEGNSRLRELINFGVVQRYPGDRMQISDAFRLSVSEILTKLDENVVNTGRMELRNILQKSFPSGHDVGRIILFLHLLLDTGEVKSFLDLASDEFFQEMGLSNEFNRVLEQIGNSDSYSYEDRFWALDALAYWSFQNLQLAAFALRVAQMEAIQDQLQNDDRVITSLLMKKMIVSAKRGNLPLTRRLYEQAISNHEVDDKVQRIIQYNYALSLNHGGYFQECEKILRVLIEKYYGVLGLSVEDVFAKNPEDIREKLSGFPGEEDDLKHLADTLNLLANSVGAQNRTAYLARWHALKFYDMAHAVTSVVRVGQDIVDEMLGILHDPPLARDFMETNLLPIVLDYRLFDYLVQVRAQYAVVLAQCGDFEGAFKNLEQLQPFVNALDSNKRMEIENQKRLISRLQTRDKLERSREVPNQFRRRIGRNSPCPCGSGKKYKRCHGKDLI